MFLPRDTDVILVLSACYAISQDEKANDYTLLEYNCYFFSWTIVMIVTRHVIPFVMPSPPAVEARLTSRLAEVTTSISDKIVSALLSLVIDTVATFRSETGSSLHKGLSKRELLVWGLPIPALRVALRQCIKLRLHYGLREKLEGRVRSQLQNRTPPVLREVLERQNDIANMVQNSLWLDKLVNDIYSPVHNETLLIFWNSLIDVLSEGYGETRADGFHHDISELPLLHRIKYRFFGKNVIQFSQIWNEALHAALASAQKAGNQQNTSGAFSHEKMFEAAFKDSCSEALRAAKDVAQRTSAHIGDPKRDIMWERVWGAWEKVWESSRVQARRMVVELVQITLDEVVGWVAEDVVRELGNNKVQKVQATIQLKKNQKRSLQDKGEELSLDVFQQSIRKFIQSVPGQTLEHRANIEDAMGRAWSRAKSYNKPIKFKIALDSQTTLDSTQYSHKY